MLCSVMIVVDQWLRHWRMEEVDGKIEVKQVNSGNKNICMTHMGMTISRLGTMSDK